MNKEFYNKKITEMLENDEYYITIENNEDKKTMTKIKRIINKHNKTTQLTTKEIDYLTNFEYKQSNFYGLPKIHKCNQIKDAIAQQNKEYIICPEPHDLTFRPIVGSPQAPTQRLSNLIDILLKPFCNHIDSYLKDSLDFLHILPDSTRTDSILTTFDITNMYSNINTKLGKEAIQYWVDNHPESLHPRFSKQFLIDVIELVLENNTFTFNNRNFRQIKGTAMGSKMSPNYSTLTLGYLEQKLYQHLNHLWGQDTSNQIKHKWKRYLDDCFIIWDLGEDKLNTFINIINNLNPHLKFTIEKNDHNIAFLDIMVIKTGTNIETDIFYKPTDTHQYLHFHSCHPRHTKRSIPYNLARRICTIVSNRVRAKARLEELKKQLILRKYPLKLINDGISKALNLDRQLLLNNNRQKYNKTEIIPFVTTYNPNNANITPITTQLINTLKHNTDTSNIFKNYQFINSKRQSQNLKNLLCKSYFSINKPIHHVRKCSDKRCGTCKYIIEADQINLNNNTLKFNESMNCASKNIIYALVCQGCSEFYIGETGNTLRERTRVHKQQITDIKYRNLYVSKHVHECGENNFKIIPIHSLNTNSTTLQRRSKEKFYIDTLKPKLNAQH